MRERCFQFISRARLAVASAIASIAVAAPSLAQNYIRTQIPSLGGAETYVADVNELGQVVGRSFTSGFSNMRAYKWSASTGSVNLGTLPGGSDSEAWALNNTGTVCGIATNSSGHRRAVKWVGTTIIQLANLGGNQSGALGINEHGDIVGYSETGGTDPNGFPIRHATLWPNSGGIVDLGVLSGGDTHSYAYDINNYGVACGYSDDGPGGAFVRHPVKFENGGVQNLGSLGGTFGHAWAINDNSEISGDSYLSGNSVTRAFKWANGVMMDVGTLQNSYSIALDINIFGQMCGVSARTLPRAVRWVGANNIIQDINSFLPGGSPTMDSAEGVNGVGQVVVEDTSADSHLLTPPVKQLPLYGPDPGIAGANNRFTVYGATPGATIRLYWSLRAGSTNVPGCPGLVLDMNNVRLGATMVADANGRASVVGFTSPAAHGRTIRYQALEYSSCRTSNRVDFAYP